MDIIRINQLLVLNFLGNAGESYGDDITKGLEAAGKSVSLSSIQSMLRIFEEKHLVVSEWEEESMMYNVGSKKIYTITEFGKKYIKQEIDAILNIGK